MPCSGDYVMVGQRVAIGRDDNRRSGTRRRLQQIVRPWLLPSATNPNDRRTSRIRRLHDKPGISVQRRRLACDEIVGPAVARFRVWAVGTDKCEFHACFPPWNHRGSGVRIAAQDDVGRTRRPGNCDAVVRRDRATTKAGRRSRVGLGDHAERLLEAHRVDCRDNRVLLAKFRRGW